MTGIIGLFKTNFLSKITTLLLAAALIAPAAQAEEAYAKQKQGHVTRTRIMSKTEATEQGVPMGKLRLFPRKTQRPGGMFASPRPILPPQAASAGQLPSWLPSPARIPRAAELRGGIMYSSSWQGLEDYPYGIYSFSTSSPASVTPIVVGEDYDISVGTLVGNEYVAISYLSLMDNIVIRPIVFDAETWAVKMSTNSTHLSSIGSDITYDEVTGNIYGCFYNEEGSALCFAVLDTIEWKSDPICSIDKPWRSISADGNGQIYAIDKDGALLKVDKATGAAQTVANTGLASAYSTSGAIDPATGIYYYAQVRADGSSSMYAIDTATGAFDLVYNFPDNQEPVGLYVPAPQAEDDAPAAATGLTAAFDGAELSGTFTFTAPSATYAGKPLAAGEQLQYSVKANGLLMAAGQCAPGQEVSAAIEVPASGPYVFSVTTANAAGESPQAKLSAYAGYDRPSPVKNVRASWQAGIMTITWDPATEGVNGGVIGTPTYSVICNGVVKAQDLTECSCTLPVEIPDKATGYTYLVRAHAEGLISEPASSNTVVLGDIVPPFIEKFDNIGNADYWTVIDSNGDGQSWHWVDGEMRVDYNADIDMDDWLVTPPVKLQAGMIYTITCTARSAGYTEKVQIKAGAGSSPAEMTQMVVPTVVLEGREGATAELDGEFMPQADGFYFFGIHGISDYNEYFLYVDNFGISEGINSAAPDAPGLTATADLGGSYKAEITCVAPDRNIGGKPLAEITKIEVSCDGKLIRTIDNPAPGESTTFEYKDAEGRHEFSAVAYNSAGQGLTATAACYMGINTPAAPAWAKIAETTPGNVKITWAPVDTDIEGMPLNPDFITYIIVNDQGIVSDFLTECEYSFQAVPDGQQEFVSYAVYACTDAGMSETGATTPMLACGPAYKLPYIETFAEGSMKYPMAYLDIVGDSYLNVATDDDFEDVASRNGDNGFAFVYCDNLNDQIDVFTGKILITGSTPEVSFYYLALGPQDDNTIRVSVECEGRTTRLGTVRCTSEKREWVKASFGLKQFLGKEAQVHFTVTGSSYSYTIFDDIRIENPLAYNLQADGFSAPYKAETGQDINVSYRIANIGMLPASGYSVSLYCDGDLAQTVENLPEIKPGESYEGEITHAFNALQAGIHQIYAYINYGADQDLTDNQTRFATITVKDVSFPTVDIAGELDEKADCAVISWAEPEMDNVPVDMLEDFESDDYEPFTITDFGPWTLKCLNDSPTFGINNIEFPNMYEAYGWILFDTEPYAMTGSWLGYGESSRYLAAFAHEKGANNAWLISPELPGEAQTISFMARSLASQYGLEKMKAYYSTSGAEIADFKELPIIGYDGGLPPMWIKYMVELPEGAKRFALVSTSNDVWVSQLDDISYRACNSFEDLVIKGYNVYRNGAKINDQPIQATTYSDTKGGTYCVTVVYEQGESRPSNSVFVATSGLADAAAAGPAVRLEGRVIVIENADAYSICAPDGKLLRRGQSQPRAALSMAPGIYVVRAGASVSKVIVK